MADTTQSVLVPAYFIHAAAGTGVVSAWFLKQKDRRLKHFGVGMMGYFLGLVAWTVLVIVKPHNLHPLVATGAIPFLLGSIAYSISAYEGHPKKIRDVAVVVTTLLVISTFIVRSFIYKSQPYFSGKGLLFFGLDPTVVALYIVTISASFLAAIQYTLPSIENPSVRRPMVFGFSVLYVNAIILVSATNQTLLLINGYAMSLALILLWSTAIRFIGNTNKAIS